MIEAVPVDTIIIEMNRVAHEAQDIIDSIAKPHHNSLNVMREKCREAIILLDRAHGMLSVTHPDKRMQFNKE